MPRRPNVRPVAHAITAGTDGRWHGFVTTGAGRRGHRSASMCDRCIEAPDIECACYRKCEDKVRELEDQVATGVGTRKATTPPWAATFFTEWVASREAEVAYKTYRSYELVVRVYLCPRVQGMRLPQFNDQDAIKKALADIKKTVSAQAARKTLTVLRIALKAAEAARLIPRNEAHFVKPPKLDKVTRVKPLTYEEAIAVLNVIVNHRLRARWMFALIHGKRQGECLGLMWYRPDDPGAPGDIDFRAGIITTREKIQRHEWRHGCDDPYACAAAPRRGRPHGHHKVKACPPNCRNHTRACPLPCTKACKKHAVACPQRWGGGLVRGTPKAEASSVPIAAHPMVLEAFSDRKVEQGKEREAAGSKWVETGYVFTTEFGAPIDPRRDWQDFQDILEQAGLPPTRVHALRHGVATFLLAQGVDKRIVKEIMGWSQDMTPVYQHVDLAMQRDAISRVGGMFWPKLTVNDQAQPPATVDDSATTVLPEAKKPSRRSRRKGL